MSEKATNYTETEQKFVPFYPHKLDRFRIGAAVIEQVYLSHPDEVFSLRLRQTKQRGHTTHSATLKNTGTMSPSGLQRLEVPGSISAERFAYYNHAIPSIRKLRAEPHEDVVIDFFENGHVQAESENPEAWQHFLERFELEDDFVDMTGTRTVDNEWIAHEHFQKWHGREAFDPPAELDIDEMVDKILRRRGVVTLGGRSGSGKTTILNEAQARLHAHGLTTASISTDDYNYGKTHLHRLGGGEWRNLDANEAYDLLECSLDVKRLKSGRAIVRRIFDFQTEEPMIRGEVTPADVTFVEGIKAHHPLLREVADLSFTIPTPFATSVGRRILRDLEHRPGTANPSSNLGMYLEYTEPAYRALQR